MIRFYLPRKDNRKLEEMSPASVRAWTACHNVFRRLTADEIRIVKAYYSGGCDKNMKTDPLRTVAESYSMSVTDVKAVIDKTIRMVAVERGLADE